MVTSFRNLERNLFVVLIGALILTLFSSIGHAKTYEIVSRNVSWICTYESNVIPILKTEGSHIFHVNDIGLPTYTRNHDCYLPLTRCGYYASKCDEYSEFVASFESSLLHVGSNRFTFGVTTTTSNENTEMNHDVFLVFDGREIQLFDIERSGTAFNGSTEVSFSLSDLNKKLADDIDALLARLNNLRSKLESKKAKGDVMPKGYDELVEKVERLDELAKKIKELSKLDPTQVSDTDLAFLDQYADLFPELKEEIKNVIKGINDAKLRLDDEIGNIVADAEDDRNGILDSLSSKYEKEKDFDVSSKDEYRTEDLGDSTDVEMPDVFEDENFDEEDNPYKAYAEEILAELQSTVVGDDVIEREHFLQVVELWGQHQKATLANLQATVGVSKEEWAAFLEAEYSVISFIRHYLGEDGWFNDSPIEAWLKNDIEEMEYDPFLRDKALNLKKALNSWSGNPSPRQILVLETLKALMEAYRASKNRAVADDVQLQSAMPTWLDEATAVVKSVAAIGVGFVPIAGDFIDICEFVTGKEMCDPNGISMPMGWRMLSALGVIAGNGKMWRVVGQNIGGPVAKIGPLVGDLVDKLKDMGATVKKWLKKVLRGYDGGVTELLAKHNLAGKHFTEVVEAIEHVGLKSLDEISAHLEVLKRWKPHFTKNGADTAENVNAILKMEGYTEPAYLAGTKVLKFQTEADDIFYRLHGEENQLGRWLLRKADVDGLTPSEMKVKYALDIKPKYICEVHVPKGTNLQTGLISPNAFGGDPTKVQFQLLEFIPKESYLTPRLLETR